jgi:hypothetical protein
MTPTARHWGLILWCVEAVRESRATGKRVPGPLMAWNSEIVSVVKQEVATSDSGSEFECGDPELEPGALERSLNRTGTHPKQPFLVSYNSRPRAALRWHIPA